MYEDLDLALALSLQDDYYENETENEANLKDESFLRKLDDDLDFALALSLQTDDSKNTNGTGVKLKVSVGSSSNTSCKPLSIVDKQWELIDPHPDIHSLFMEFNTGFFYGKLRGVEVKWSSRMTLCAGVCSYEGRGGLCSVRLSLPLLKLRPRRDLVETLLHEMIHAYLFVTHNNKDHGDHGPEFLKHMDRINKETGTRITVYHSFHDEVDLYRKHWWKCNGPCQNKKPFYGLVKRAMNRAPGPCDNWWDQHKATCGGTFIKIKEPEDSKKKAVKRKNCLDEVKKEKSSLDIRNLLKQGSTKPASALDPEPANMNEKLQFNKQSIKSILGKEDNIVGVNGLGDKSSNLGDRSYVLKKDNFVPFTGKGHTLGSSSSKVPLRTTTAQNIPGNKGAFCQTDMPPSSSTLSPFKKKRLIQSPMENFMKPTLAKVVKASLPQDEKTVIKNSQIKFENSDIMVSCPVCLSLVNNAEINRHLDSCITKDA